MKKLRVISMRDQRDKLMRELMHLGCVQVHEPAEMLEDPEAAELLTPERAGLTSLRTDQSEIQSAIKILSRYAPEKKKFLAPRPSVREKEFLDAEALKKDIAEAKQITGWESDLRRLATEESRLRTDAEALRPWAPMDEAIDGAGTKTCGVALMSALAEIDMASVTAAAEEVTDAVQIIPVSDDLEQHSFAVVAMKDELSAVVDAMRSIGCTQVTFPGLKGTAGENIKRLEGELLAIAKQRDELIQNIVSKGRDLPALKLSADRIESEVQRASATECLSGTESVVALEGWFPASEQSKLEKMLGGFDVAWEFSEPSPEEYPDVPVKLKNSKPVASMNMGTDMYSLPAYDGVDPNPLMFPFFGLFYGMMMADMGYGLLMMLASIVIVKRKKPWGPTERYMYPLLGLCGISTFIWGAITGGFFGDLLPQMAKIINPNTTFTAMPALFSPLNDALMVLIGALALGVVQIFTGMGINACKKIRRGEGYDALFEEGTWFVLLIGLALFALKITPIVLILGGLMLVAGSVYKAVKEGGGPVKIVFGTLKGIGGSLYNNVTGYFSDILSYSRLMALMLAGAVIAQVFNTLGAITGNIVTFFIIAMVGNALNFALNLLGCFVHDMRLQCLEFFGRFYEDGGKPFRPLDMKTNYVDIVKE